jgi:hypothetical protein
LAPLSRKRRKFYSISKVGEGGGGGAGGEAPLQFRRYYFGSATDNLILFLIGGIGRSSNLMRLQKAKAQHGSDGRRFQVVQALTHHIMFDLKFAKRCHMKKE